MMRMPLPEDDTETTEERQLRLLAEAAWILMDGSKPSPVDADAINKALAARFRLDELRRAENWIVSRAEMYRHEAELSARSARIKDATAPLLRIEKACADLARAFDEASLDAYSVLDGYAPGGTNYRHLAWNPRGSGTARDFQTLLAITGRYLLPLGPGHDPKDRVTDMLSIGPAAVQPHTVASAGNVYTDPGEPVSWSEAVAALGMRIGMLREDFDERFRRQDVGGKQAKYSEQVRGGPKWILARECRDVAFEFPEYWYETKITGQKTGRFAELVYAIYEFATGQELSEKRQHKGKGDVLDGLDRYVRGVVNIYPRLVELNQRGSNISKEDKKERERLQMFWNTGKDPEAPERPKTMKPEKAIKKTRKAKKAPRSEAA